MTRRVPRADGISSASSAPQRSPVAVARSLGAVSSFRVSDEGARTRLISDISSLLHEPAIPESARSAGLELIGWLARRMPGEAPHALGVAEAHAAKRAPRRKVR
jgi:hypothetical protein